MIEFKRYGKTVRIGNEHWANFRERFNPDNAKKAKKDRGFVRRGDFLIRIPCSLCKTFFKKKCKRCPFDKFSIRWSDGKLRNPGCNVFIEKLFYLSYFWMERDKVGWKKDDDLAARKQLKRIQKLMDEIEEENKLRT